MNGQTMTVAGKRILLFPAEKQNAPLVLLHTVRDEGTTVFQAARRLSEADFSFAAVGGLDWDREMSPWPCPPLFQGDTPCSGGADAYLESLTGEILPAILARLPAPPSSISLAGYSLAGLFAVYAMHKTELFARVASASGSFWYPDFLEYATQHKPLRNPERLYVSLGDKEAKTRHKILRTVEENTRALCEHYKRMGIATVFERNPGNHFRDTEERMAKGIAWILEA